MYIVDKGNNRVVVLDKYYKAKTVISSYEANGKTHTFNNPQGIYVTDPENSEYSDKKYIYVCDTGNFQIVVFDENFEYVRTIVKPDSPVLPPTRSSPALSQSTSTVEYSSPQVHPTRALSSSRVRATSQASSEHRR